MSDPKLIEARIVLIADLPKDVKEDIELFNKVVRANLEYYSQVYGIPRRVWVNSKDAPEEVETVDGKVIERRGGCVRGKIMVF